MIKNKIKNIAGYALDSCLKNGCTAARLTLNNNIQSSYSVRNDKLDRLQQANGSSLYVQIFTEGKYGAYSTNRMERHELDNFISNAVDATKYLTPDNCRVLPDKSLYYKGKGEGLEQYDSSFPSIDPDKKCDIAFNCAAEIYKKDPMIISVNCEYGDSDDYTYIIDSQGFEGEGSQTTFTLSAECSVKGTGDSKPEGWWYESSIFIDKLLKEGVGTKAFERAASRLNPRKLKSGKYNLVVENTVSSRLISPIISALNGTSIQQNNSFLKGKIGEKVFSEGFTLTDNPHLRGAYGSRFFDSEGIATKEMNIIEKGIVTNYYINTYNSLKLKLPVTIEGPSVPSCVFNYPGKTVESHICLEHILTKCEKGILVTGFNGGNSNSSTGDFSFGVQGFYFENGIILYPIKEMNITGNIIKLWNGIAEIGTDPRMSGRWLIPTLAFESVNFSGI
jgi:PmbA protein